MKNKAFTLIELLAVLVVLAILALISVPITIRVINSARENSYKRSIESYAKTFEKVIALDSLSSEKKYLSEYVSLVENNYSGNRVKCRFKDNDNDDNNYSTLIDGKLVLRECRVVKNNDILSRNTYKYENGYVVREDVIDYSVGDDITVAGEKYYIIKNSLDSEDYVVALKAIPLTVAEVNAVGSEYINRNTMTNKGTANVINDFGTNIKFGGVAYYSSETCGYPYDTGSSTVRIETGCKNDYDDSDIKQIVNSWAANKFVSNELKEVNNYKARLINIDELDNLGYIKESNYYSINSNVPSWVYNDYYSYYTMTPFNPSNCVWVIDSGRTGTIGRIAGRVIMGEDTVIRPVINVYKSKID